MGIFGVSINIVVQIVKPVSLLVEVFSLTGNWSVLNGKNRVLERASRGALGVVGVTPFGTEFSPR